MRILVIAGACVGLIWAPNSFSETVYKWRADDGSVTYSTAAPAPTQDIAVEEVEVSTSPLPNTGQQGRSSAVADLLRRSERIGEQAAQRADRRKQLKQMLVVERNHLNRLKEQATKESLPGERLANVGGGTRLGPAYFKRQAKQEKEIEEQEAKIKALKKELKALRR